jgi:hypothetical protein
VAAHCTLCSESRSPAGFPGELPAAFAGNNRSVNNVASGMVCAATGSGIATLVTERNEALANNFDFAQSGTCSFESMGNNTVENNGTNVTGVITPATLR